MNQQICANGGKLFNFSDMSLKNCSKEPLINVIKVAEHKITELGKFIHRNIQNKKNIKDGLVCNIFISLLIPKTHNYFWKPSLVECKLFFPNVVSCMIVIYI